MADFPLENVEHHLEINMDVCVGNAAWRNGGDIHRKFPRSYIFFRKTCLVPDAIPSAARARAPDNENSAISLDARLEIAVFCHAGEYAIVAATSENHFAWSGGVSKVPVAKRFIVDSLTLASILAMAGCREIPDLSNRVGFFEVVDGNTQTIPAGTTAPIPLTIRALDELRTPLRGIEVRWIIASGGGALSSSTSTTDNTGTASVTYTAPAQPGPVTVHATVPPELTVHFALAVVTSTGS